VGKVGTTEYMDDVIQHAPTRRRLMERFDQVDEPDQEAFPVDEERESLLREILLRWRRLIDHLR
jgi:hypothetical protein